MSGHAAVLVDLDGTITDPAPGILASYRQALAAVGREPQPDADLRWVIGPPLRVSFARFVEAGEVETVLSHYRAHYSAGAMYDLAVHAHMHAACRAMKAAFGRLYVATSKPTHYARPIIERFGFAEIFDQVYGAELDGRLDHKAELIAHIVATEGLDPARTVMIGDREHDVKGAAANAIPCIGVAWGFGPLAELAGAGSRALADDARDLPGLSRVIAGV
jgi:phosphoglycolate phosphatase